MWRTQDSRGQIGLKLKVVKTFQVVASSLGSGPGKGMIVLRFLVRGAHTVRHPNAWLKSVDRLLKLTDPLGVCTRRRTRPGTVSTRKMENG